jgi:hypothetical protein
MATELPPIWEKIKVLSVVIATVTVPVVVAVVGNSYSREQKEKEIGVRYVELALEILRTAPGADNKALRTWAISVVDHYSALPLPKEAQTELQFEQLKLEVQNLSKVQQEASDLLNKLDEQARDAIRGIKEGQRK